MFVYTVFDVLRRTYVVQMLYSPSLGDCVIFKGLTKPLSISELVDQLLELQTRYAQALTFFTRSVVAELDFLFYIIDMRKLI